MFIGFEPVEGKPNRVKCLPCSETSLRVKEIMKSTISNHRKSAAHKAALERGSISSTRASDMLDVTMTALQSSSLNVAEAFELSDSDEDAMEDIWAETSNPFDGAMIYDHDINDSAGNAVLFRAGSIPKDRTREQLVREIESLSYSDHPRLGAMATEVEDLGLQDDSGGDSTIANVMVALQNMGAHNQKYQ